MLQESSELRDVVIKLGVIHIIRREGLVPSQSLRWGPYEPPVLHLEARLLLQTDGVAASLVALGQISLHEPGNEASAELRFVAVDDAGDEMVVLNVPVAGTTTAGSKNPRVELRQMRANSNANAGFGLDEPVSVSKIGRAHV